MQRELGISSNGRSKRFSCLILHRRKDPSCGTRIFPILVVARLCGMASRCTLSYAQRASEHPNRLTARLLGIAEAKKTNITLSADLTTTKELLAIADGKRCASRLHPVCSCVGVIRERDSRLNSSQTSFGRGRQSLKNLTPSLRNMPFSPLLIDLNCSTGTVYCGP